MTKSISILGSTGSIGTQGLMVCENLGYRVPALAGGSNDRLLEEQARKWRPDYVAVADEGRYLSLKQRLADTGILVEAGGEAVCRAAAWPGADLVLNAVVGIAGLRPTLAAIEAGRDVALSNKETLVAGGALVTAAARERGVRIFPVDSEHSAMFQCMQAGSREQVRGVILTASGGPFFGKGLRELEEITPAQALRHPNWTMGSKITVDSATLMNKGLEFIEAMWLFDLRPDQIEVLVHRQSVVHSAVEFQDGSVIAQLGTPDMRCAIQYAMTWPDHLPAEMERLRLADYGSLTFQRPDVETFRCLAVCMAAAERGGLAACVANGANEAAVELFLREEIGFLEIGELVAGAVEAVAPPGTGGALEEIEAADRAAREFVLERKTGDGGIT